MRLDTRTHTRTHTLKLSWGPSSCFTECETQSTAGRKGNFRLQRREHLSVFQCHSCLGWMEKSDIVCLCLSMCVCAHACVDKCMCVSFLLTYTISHLLPLFCCLIYWKHMLPETSMCQYTVKLLHWKKNALLHFCTTLMVSRGHAALTVREYHICSDSQVFIYF